MDNPRSITKYDILFFYECCAALLVNTFVLHWNIAFAVILVLIGLSFELMTASSWTYSREFRKSLFVVNNTDVSLMAAFSWAGVLMFFCALSSLLLDHVVFSGSRVIIPVLIVGIGGNILETVCLRWGMFIYNNTPVTRMFILHDPMFIWGVPLSVRLGYFIIFGPLCSVLLLIGS